MRVDSECPVNREALVDVSRYSEEDSAEWDNFVATSRNGHFMVQRSYLAYHGDRFIDNSLIVRNAASKIIMVIPFNRRGKAVFSHEGLSFAGPIVGYGVSALDVQRCMNAVVEWLKRHDVSVAHLRLVPDIYHLKPSADVRHFIFGLGGVVGRTRLSATIDLRERYRISHGKLNGYRRALRDGLFVGESTRLDAFHEMLTSRLMTRRGAQPVHSLDQLRYLFTRHPDHVVLVTAEEQDRVLAGAMWYVDRGVAHLQYVASTEEGRRRRCVDAAVIFGIERFKDLKYIDFGHSHSPANEQIDWKLLRQKEEFGAGYSEALELVLHL